MFGDFKAFLLKQNVIALAIAVVIGAALNTLVQSLVADFIMPIIGAAAPGGDWQKATWDVGPVKFGIGHFLAALINFVIIAFIAWRISRAFARPSDSAPTKNCPYCRMSMDATATRCPSCTSQLAAV
ncbi:MAG TPA: MscL family protein [Gemmatimonadaceae bacterium]|nr:MscL family protein [Gemmatimonadaceae bacterium]